MKSEHKSKPDAAPSWSVLKTMHIGKRERQEDAVGFWENKNEGLLFAVVADGAGGHGGGAEASAAAVTEAERCWQAGVKAGNAAEFLAGWMGMAHDAVNRSARLQHAGARTVAVALLVQGTRADWVHAGDCRLYHFRAGKLLTRTRDDSVVQVLFENGEITEGEMGTHEDQNRLLQAIGGGEPPKPRHGSAVIESEDVFLLCSDGFWEHLKPEEIADLVDSPKSRWSEVLHTMVNLAVNRGGEKADNASVILAGFGEPNALQAPRLRSWGCWVLLVAAVAVGLGLCFWYNDRLTGLWERHSPPVRATERTSPDPTGLDHTREAKD
jgi:serine/threonine protein phosphatase PrpC